MTVFGGTNCLEKPDQGAEIIFLPVLLPWGGKTLFQYEEDVRGEKKIYHRRKKGALFESGNGGEERRSIKPCRLFDKGAALYYAKKKSERGGIGLSFPFLLKRGKGGERSTSAKESAVLGGRTTSSPLRKRERTLPSGRKSPTLRR